MSLFQSWGFGAILEFRGEKAIAGMTRAERTVRSLQMSFESISRGTSMFTSSSGAISAMHAHGAPSCAPA